MKLSNKQTTIICFVLILGIGLILRLVAANTLPLTNDEGSYLYDAYLLGQGHLPFFTSFSRAPALMIPLALWLKVFGVSVASGRLFISLISLGSAVLLYFIGKEVSGRKLGFLALLLYTLVSPVAVHSSYLLTEPLEIFYSLFGSLFLIKSVRNGLYSYVLASGIGFGLAVATRETAVVYPLFLAAFLLVSGRKNFVPVFKKLFIAGLITIITWLSLWGWVATQVGIAHVIKNFEAVFTMHNTGERLTFGFIMRGKLGEFWYLKIDYGIFYVSTIIFGVFAVIKRWYQNRNFWLLLALASGPILFYGLYYKRIQPEYFGSFMPGFVLMSAWVVRKFLDNRKQKAESGVRTCLKYQPYSLCYLLSAICFLIIDLLTFRYQLIHNRGGTFYLKPLDNVVSWVKNNTNSSDEFFTAAVAIPLFSNRPLALDISRPVTFGYPHIKPEIKYALFPTPKKVMDYLTIRQVKYYIVEKATRDSFYTGHDDLKEYLMQNYVHLKTFENPTNPIEIWIRRS